MDYQLYPAQELGLDQGRLQDLVGRLQYAIDGGPLPSLQVAVARHGRLALFETLGEADNRSRYNIYSCIKPLVASAVWKLMGEGNPCWVLSSSFTKRPQGLTRLTSKRFGKGSSSSQDR